MSALSTELPLAHGGLSAQAKAAASSLLIRSHKAADRMRGEKGSEPD